jgi:hypothetical protein
MNNATTDTRNILQRGKPYRINQLKLALGKSAISECKAERDLKSPDKGKQKAGERIKISTGNTRIGKLAGGLRGGIGGGGMNWQTK